MSDDPIIVNPLIPINTAALWAKNFRNMMAATPVDPGVAVFNTIKAFYLSYAEIDITKHEKHPTGCRFYFGLKQTKTTPTTSDFVLMAVAVDINANGGKGEDLYVNGIAGETSFPCPNYCDPNSKMNS